jgi:hypothetical protein
MCPWDFHFMPVFLFIYPDPVHFLSLIYAVALLWMHLAENDLETARLGAIIIETFCTSP